jgi:hypothetical protein
MWNRFRQQKYRNGGQLWVVNVFSYTIHAQNLGHRAHPLPFPSFSLLTVTFPKLAVILRPLHRLGNSPTAHRQTEGSDFVPLGKGTGAWSWSLLFTPSAGNRDTVYNPHYTISTFEILFKKLHAIQSLLKTCDTPVQILNEFVCSLPTKSVIKNTIFTD